MAIVLGRIDNRLLHGIVASQWTPVSGSSRVMVVDDKIASDPNLKGSMKLAKPAGVALSIITEKVALTNFKAGKYDPQKVFIIAKTPEIFVKLNNLGYKTPKLVIGGTTVREESTKLSSRADATTSEIDQYQQLIADGTKVEIQYIPADKAIDFSKVV